ncbi:L-threonylcarbamoyladenylate synthase [Candidatus Woesearchaeota archaeon]|nr:L-threonylcarbamoyladenylate synthase [Candidatus Woesearchaeota archaeon]
MRILNADELKLEKEQIINAIIEGAVFIYPTDTIYGLGCTAQFLDSVKKIRNLKGRATNPFSVIAPSIEWIRENCIVTKEAEEWLDRLPGPYTLILKLKNKKCVAKNVNPGLDTLGVRIPNHWFKNIVAEAEIPVVTTSVNKSGEDYMTSLEDLDVGTKEKVDFILYEGKKEGKPSKIISLAGKLRISER